MSASLPLSLPHRLGGGGVSITDLPPGVIIPEISHSRFRFLICPILSSIPIGELDVTDVQFTQSVDGSGTTFTGQVVLSSTQSADKVKALLNYPYNPRAVALYVLVDDTYLWGGPIQSRPWEHSTRSFAITATSWKAWLYQRFIGPNTAINPVADITYGYTNTEQFDIARAIVGFATTGDGTPTIATEPGVSAVNRDLNWFGSEFKLAGDLIDSMASRVQGFEWDVLIQQDSAGNPALKLALYYPKRVIVNGGVIFKSTPTGGNVLDYTNPDDSAEHIITRVWGAGSGTAGTDLLMAYDQDPDLSDDNILLVESKEYDNSTTTDINTIAGHVQGIRKFHASGLQQITVTVPLDSPDFLAYNIGDKVRLIVNDEVQDIDYNTVRIVRRVFNVNASGTSPKADSCQLLIDLNDVDLPQDDEALS